MQFDPAKAASNLEKHEISFSDAEPVFFDERAVTTFKDCPTVRGIERRGITTGTDALGRVITVIWTWRDDDYRPICARPARRKERKAYEA
jgi:uncharacterized DUF497 family protein